MHKTYFGKFGGQFVPETLMGPLFELEKAYIRFSKDPVQKRLLKNLLKTFAGRPTSLYFAENLTKYCKGAKIYLKREDLTHTGAHKINNAIGQALLAKYMGKKRIIAETGAGQHGVAVAAACAKLGIKCVVYMGSVDIARQSLNVQRMKLFGAKIISSNCGSKTLKDAVNDAIRDWICNLNDSYYLLGSALGPHPYPKMVRNFQKIIGQETRGQILKIEKKLPDYLIACVGGGSNSIGLFSHFIKDKNVKMVGVEAGGLGIRTGKHAARFATGKMGILHGSKSFVLENRYGQILKTHSVSAGLDYPSVGPEHSFLRSIKRVKYTHATDKQALNAFELLSEKEGIIPAMESAHAIAYGVSLAKKLPANKTIVINLSGRGDKDLTNYEQNR